MSRKKKRDRARVDEYVNLPKYKMIVDYSEETKPTNNMKKLFTILALMFGIIPCFAQIQANKVDFTLLETAQFVCSEDHADTFYVIPFEDKSAEELYSMLMQNATLVVNNPDKQVAGVENSVVKVRAEQSLLTEVVMMLPLQVTGTVIYEFQIKDGKIRVNAPYVEGGCHYGTSARPASFKSAVKGYFKKGQLKEKKAAEFNHLIAKTNNVINTILGVSKAAK